MRTIVLFAGLMLCVVWGRAQTNHYTETKTFYEPGYTYQCDVIESGFVTLYNKSNKWTYVGQIDTTTGEHFVMPEYDYIPLFEDDDWTWTENKCDSIVNNAFPAAMKQWVKGRDLVLYDTGILSTVPADRFSAINFLISPCLSSHKIQRSGKKKILLSLPLIFLFAT